MAKYIDCESLLKSLSQECKDCENNFGYDCEECDYAHAMLYVRAEKAADVQPVKQGHWYHNTSKYVSELDAYFIQACCSCCNRYSDKIDQYSQIMSNETCSHCGADMRNKEENENDTL